MKIAFDWKGWLKAVCRVSWPFLAGALGGLAGGCSFFGTGVGVTL